MRSAIAVVVVVVAGCGRIGFDPAGLQAGDAGGAGGAGGGGGIVNGPCTPFVQRMNMSAHVSPGLAWIGDGYALYTGDDSDYGLVSVAVDGSVGPLAPVVSTAVTIGAGRDQIAWNGIGLGAMWTDDGVLEFEVYSHALAAASGAHQVVPTGGTSAHMAWAGDRFVVAWPLGGSVNVAEVGGDGAVLAGKSYPGTSGLVQAIGVAATSYLLATGTSIFAVPRPIGSAATTSHALGFSGGGAVDLIAFGDGFVALQADALQVLDATGAPASPVIPVPGFVYPLTTTTLAPLGSGVRIVGYSGPSDSFELVWIDFDPVTRQFGAPGSYGVIDATMPMPAPSVVAAPGRLLIAAAWDDPTGHIALIQQCAP